MTLNFDIVKFTMKSQSVRPVEYNLSNLIRLATACSYVTYLTFAVNIISGTSAQSDQSLRSPHKESLGP